MPTVAETLRQAREEQGLSVPDIVDQTKMKVDQVQAIEAGDWGAFAAPVYTRGFVKSYASILKLDGEAILEELNAELGAAKPDGGDALDAPLRSGLIDGIMLQFSHVKWSAVVPIILLVLVAVGVFFGREYYQNFNSTDHLEGLGDGMNLEPVVSEADRLPIE